MDRWWGAGQSVPPGFPPVTDPLSHNPQLPIRLDCFSQCTVTKRVVDGCRILVYSSACSQLFGGWGCGLERGVPPGFPPCSQLFGGWGCGLERVFHLAFHLAPNSLGVGVVGWRGCSTWLSTWHRIIVL